MNKKFSSGKKAGKLETVSAKVKKATCTTPITLDSFPEEVLFEILKSLLFLDLTKLGTVGNMAANILRHANKANCYCY